MKNSYIVYLILFITYFLYSPITYNLNIEFKYVLVFCYAVILSRILFRKDIKLNIKIFLGIIVLIISSTITSVYYSTFIPLKYVMYFISTVLLVNYLKKEDFIKLTRIGSVIVIILLLGAWLSLLYYILGGRPILELENIDRIRTVQLYLTSFSHQSIFIRPMAIYDEPGAFSFVITFTALMRNFLKFNRKSTLYILLAGFITFSLAHTIYTVFHIISQRIKAKLLLTITVMIFGLSSIPQVATFFDQLLIQRLTFSKYDDKVLQGDNRTELLFNSYRLLDSESFLWGVGKLAITDWNETKEEIGGIGENVLTPLVRRGILISWPFYLVIFIFIYLSIKRRENILFLALALLFFQRPNIMDFTYSYYALIPLFYYKKYITKNE